MGEKFYKGLLFPTREKFASVTFIDRRNYELVAYHVIRFNKVSLLKQREKASEKELQDQFNGKQLYYHSPKSQSSFFTNQNTFQISYKSFEPKSQISKDIKNHHISNNLCLFDSSKN